MAKTEVVIDPTQNTVKLDPANNTVKLPTPVAVTQSGPVTVTGSVEITKLPAQPAPIVNVAQSFPDVMPVTVENSVRVAGLAGMRHAVTYEGGRSGYGTTTGGVHLDQMPTVAPGMEQSRDNPVPVVVALFVNPAGSGIDANLQRISLGSSGAGEWTRLGWPDRIELAGPPQPVINRGQGENTAKCRLYIGNNGRGFNGRRSKTTFQREWSTIDDDIDGTIICRPGMSICWLFELSFGSGQRAAVEVLWWETPAAADR